MADTVDEKRRDEVLKRMLATPPKPHDGKAPNAEGVKRPKPAKQPSQPKSED